MSKLNIYCVFCKRNIIRNENKKYICTFLQCEKAFKPLKIIDINYRGEGDERGLSNLFPHEFTFMGVKCGSMEGFIRSLAEKDTEIQEKICLLSGVNAYKIKYALRDWRDTQELYWKNIIYKRQYDKYFQLILSAFQELYKQNCLYKYFIDSTKEYTLIHSIGCTDKKESLLTPDEYIKILNIIRR